MKNRLLFLFFILIPISLLVWFAYKAQSNERLAAQQQYQNLAYSQLKRVDEKMINYFQQLETALVIQRTSIEQQLIQLNDDAKSTSDGIRQFLNYSPYIQNIYIADKEHNRLYPRRSQNHSEKELSFLSNIHSIVQNHSLFTAQTELQGDSLKSRAKQTAANDFSTISKRLSPLNRSSRNQAEIQAQQQGWIAWYRDRHLHHLFWFKDEQQRLYLLFLDRIRILSEIIALLPETALDINEYNQGLKDTSIRLNNSNNEVIYEWGDYPVSEQQSIDLMLSYPLSSWKLSWYAKEFSEKNFTQQWSLMIIALMASLFMLLLMILFYREYHREIRLAQQRVNFVSQVSHELKTPLTNIRMYAELLEQKLESLNVDEDQEESPERKRSQHFVAIIVNESLRLSRLIENVLSFSKVQKHHFKLNKTSGVIDDCIEQVLMSFQAVFEQKKIQINFNKNAGETVSFDAQLLEQILNNLLSNIEKYAAQGKRIDIHSEQMNGRVTIEIRDFGPGISKAEQKKIFKPFYRSSSKLTEGVSGTGIGLTISQQLAVLHGGLLYYRDVPKGACFVIELNVEAEYEQ